MLQRIVSVSGLTLLACYGHDFTLMIVCSCEVSKTSKTVTEKMPSEPTHAKQLPASQRHALDTFRSRELPTGSPLQMS